MTAMGARPARDQFPADLDLLRDRLRQHGAPFAFLHGSRVAGRVRDDSDVDVAAWLPAGVDSWAVEVPDQVDLVNLRSLPLYVAGRIALHGVLLFDDDPPARVRWQATTRQRYFDETRRRRMITADILEAAGRG